MHTAAKAALDGGTGPYTTMDGLGGMGGMCWPTVGLLDSLSLQITPIPSTLHISPAHLVMAHCRCTERHEGRHGFQACTQCGW